MTVETITPWLRYMLIAVGMMYFITESTLFSFVRVAVTHALPARVRFMRVFLYCPACVGFWIGAALGALHLWPADDGSSWAIIECGLATMALGAVWGAHYGGNIDRIYETEDLKEKNDDALAETQAEDDEDTDERS